MGDSHLRHLLILIGGVRVINTDPKDNKRASSKSRPNSIDTEERQRQVAPRQILGPARYRVARVDALHIRQLYFYFFIFFKSQKLHHAFCECYSIIPILRFKFGIEPSN
jgi:hypothetical protein